MTVGKHATEEKHRIATSHDCAWAAGIVEGEGSIVIGRNGSKRSLMLKVTVPNTDRQMLEFLHARWGGSITAKWSDSPRHKPAQVWGVATAMALAFLQDIYPYIVRDHVRQRADVAMAFQRQKVRSQSVARSQGYRDRQDEFYYTLKALNARGTQPAPIMRLPTRQPLPSGEQHRNAKLTNQQAAEIRLRRDAGEARAALAKEFGVSPAVITRIVSGDSYVVASPARIGAEA